MMIPPDAIPANTERVFQKTNPATGEIMAEYRCADAATVDAAVTNAAAASPHWAAQTLKQRANVLHRWADLLMQDRDALARLISRETGKPLKDALESDLMGAIGVLRYYGNAGPGILKDRLLPPNLMSLLMGRLHRQRFVPLGVVGVISPWNYPLAIAVSGIATALMAGNAVVFKPSELTPGVGQYLVERLQEALQQSSQPLELIQLLQGDGETGKLLVAHPQLDAVVFTGSSRVGRQIQQTLAARNKPCSLELGGSDPCIILPGSELESVSSAILWGRFTNAGQACAAIKRVYVHRAQEKELLTLLQCKISQLRVGAPDQPDTHLGPLISEAQRQTVLRQLNGAIQGGAQVLVGGASPDRPGYYVSPTLVSNVPPDSPLLCEEVFGPVLPVVAYDSVEEAVTLANLTPYGLTASVFGPEAKAIAERLNFATVVLNDAGPGNYAIPAAPWRGWQDSGPGVSHSPDALREMSRTQLISTNLMASLPLFAKAPWYFSPQPSEGLCRTLLSVVSRGPLGLLSPALALKLWQNRSGRKI